MKKVLSNRWFRSLLVVVLLGGIGAGVMAWQGQTKETAPPPAQTAQASPPPAANPATQARSEPARLRIPKLKVDASVIELGLQQSGEIEVPQNYADTGWYKFGPTPGETGPAVIAGHLDSPSGPAVFVELEKLQPGDAVEVARRDGSTVKFMVTASEKYPQKEFPTEKVYGTTTQAEVRLITCDGLFDKSDQRYSHNLVVYGKVAP